MHEHDVRTNLSQWVLHLLNMGIPMLLLMSLASCDGCHVDVVQTWVITCLTSITSPPDISSSEPLTLT